MATLILPCRYPGCPNARVEGETTCPQHRGKVKYADWSRRYKPEQVQGTRWKKLRARVLAREPYCRMCGARAVVVDHIVPRRAGGDDSPGNLQALCRACDNRKRAAENREFPKK